MVRINLIHPTLLADQHLIAEYNEILMLFGYVKKHQSCKNVPDSFKLGKGHILFFKNKLSYLKDRHNSLKKEMLCRKFKPTKTISLSTFDKELLNTWKASRQDKMVVKERLISKIKQKPGYYRYFGKPKSTHFFLRLLKSQFFS